MTIEFSERELIVLHGSLLALIGLFSDVGNGDVDTLHAEQEVRAVLAKLETAFPSEVLVGLKAAASATGLTK